MKEEVKEIIKRFDLISPGSRVVVSVSGGPDSVALLCVLNQIKDEMDFYLHVAHLNHGFREKSAEEDASFVRDLAKKLNLPFTIKKWNVKRYVKEKGISTQLGARKLRYRFLARVAERLGADTIALGHNKDDQVETFLIRLLRGSGLDGLSGIPIKREMNFKSTNINIVRPLLYISRRRIENYLKVLGQSYKIDPTNQKAVYMRNKIRLEIIPWLEESTPNFKDLVFDTTELLSLDNDYLNQKANELFESVKIKSIPGFLSLDYSRMKEEHEAMVNRVLKKAVYEASGGKRLEKKHVDYLNKLLNNEIKGPITLPGDTSVDKKDNMVIFQPLKKLGDKKAGKVYSRVLEAPGKTYWEPLECYIKADILDYVKRENYQKKPEEAFLDYDKLAPQIYVRTRKKGDRFSPLGMNKKKKLKDFFIDLKIPPEERDMLPLIISGEEIVWIAPYRINDKYKVTKETNKILHLKLLREDEDDRGRKF